ncbi:MAG: hypothetical protein WCR06_10005, partial [bacterium]
MVILFSCERSSITRGRQSHDSCLPATGRGCIAWFAWIISVSERCAKHELIDSVRIAEKQAPSSVFEIEIAANGRLTAISSKSGACHVSIASHALLLSISSAISISIAISVSIAILDYDF